jgi:hypothetical protein
MADPSAAPTLQSPAPQRCIPFGCCSSATSAQAPKSSRWPLRGGNGRLGAARAGVQCGRRRRRRQQPAALAAGRQGRGHSMPSRAASNKGRAAAAVAAAEMREARARARMQHMWRLAHAALPAVGPGLSRIYVHKLQLLARDAEIRAACSHAFTHTHMLIYGPRCCYPPRPRPGIDDKSHTRMGVDAVCDGWGAGGPCSAVGKCAGAHLCALLLSAAARRQLHITQAQHTPPWGAAANGGTVNTGGHDLSRVQGYLPRHRHPTHAAAATEDGTTAGRCGQW